MNTKTWYTVNIKFKIKGCYSKKDKENLTKLFTELANENLNFIMLEICWEESTNEYLTLDSFVAFCVEQEKFEQIVDNKSIIKQYIKIFHNNTEVDFAVTSLVMTAFRTQPKIPEREAVVRGAIWSSDSNLE